MSSNHIFFEKNIGGREGKIAVSYGCDMVVDTPVGICGFWFSLVFVLGGGEFETYWIEE